MTTRHRSTGCINQHQAPPHRVSRRGHASNLLLERLQLRVGSSENLVAHSRVGLISLSNVPFPAAETAPSLATSTSFRSIWLQARTFAPACGISGAPNQRLSRKLGLLEAEAAKKGIGVPAQAKWREDIGRSHHCHGGCQGLWQQRKRRAPD